MPFNEDILARTRSNSWFREVLSTGRHSQVVVMSIPVGGEVGEVFAVGFFDPVAIGRRRARFADGDRHSLSWKENGRGKSRVLRAIRPAVQA